MKLKLLSTIILVILLPFVTKAQYQHSKLDSLKMALKNAGNDTARMVTLFNLSSYYVESNRDSSTFLGEQSNRLAKKLNQPLWTAQYLLVNAYFSMQQGDYSSAFKLCHEALNIIQDEKNEKNVYIPNDDQFAKDPHKYRLSLIMGVYHQLGNIYASSGNNEKGIEYFKKEIDLSNSLNSNEGLVESNMNIGQEYANMKKFDSSLIYSRKALNFANVTGDKTYVGYILDGIGSVYFINNQIDSALKYYHDALLVDKEQNNVFSQMISNISFASLYKNLHQPDLVKLYATEALQLAIELNQPYFISSSSDLLAGAWKMKGNADSAFAYLSTAKRLRDSLSADQNQKLTKFQNLNFEAQTQLEKEAQNSIDAKNKIRIIALIFGIALLSILAFVFYRNNLQKQKANKVLQKTLTDLKSTQTLLIQSEKMASLGELTAGIAHEIQNPLNFVNNFSDLNTELIDELQEGVSNGNYEEIKTIANAIQENEQKINHHGKRAGDIVKGMLEHSRSSKGVKEPTDINALADEYLRLSYYGLRAKDKNFNAEIKTDFDESIGKINIIPQNIGRVFLNLFNNAFYAVNEQKIQNSISYNPTVSVKSEKCDGKVRITVRDNGKGIPQKIIDKIFQPFFTTKPTGEGTGLGLSLSYDIIKAHGGEIKVESKEGEGSEFVIHLPNV